MKTYEERVADLERQIAALREEKRKESQALLDSVSPVYQFVCVPAAYSMFGQQCWDDTVTCYEVAGQVTNRTQMTEAGHSRLHEGSMKYLYNTLSGKFITAVGGGSTFVSKGLRRDSEDPVPAFMEALGAWVKANPEGGDCTELVNQFRQA